MVVSCGSLASRPGFGAFHPTAGRVGEQNGRADDNQAILGDPMRRLTPIVLFVLTLAGCGDALGGVGDFSHKVVYGDETTTTSTTLPSGGSRALGLVGITDVAWSNDGLDAVTASLDRDALITAVWLRGDQSTPFVQATRREIATALPGIEFPQLAPQGVTDISSQLLFDQLTGILDASQAAAFGFWVGEPYGSPRSEGQLAVLRVGMATAGDAETEEVFSFQVTDGRELVWTSGDYVYQLFCRTGLSESACFAMADSMIPLSLIVELR